MRSDLCSRQDDNGIFRQVEKLGSLFEAETQLRRFRRAVCGKGFICCVHAFSRILPVAGGVQLHQDVAAHRVQGRCGNEQAGIDAAAELMQFVGASARLFQAAAHLFLIQLQLSGFRRDLPFRFSGKPFTLCPQPQRHAFLRQEEQVDGMLRIGNLVEACQAFQDAAGCGHVLLRAVAEHVCGALPRQVAVRKPAAGKHAAQGLQVRMAAIQRLSAGGHRGSDIFRALHPALDLKRTHAGLRQFLHVGDIAHVFQRQRVVSAPDLPVQAAGLGAQAPVAGAAAEHGRHVAVAGDAHAVGAVHKHLTVRAGLFDDLPDLRQRQFSGQHDAHEAVIQELSHPVRIADRHLRGRVKGQIRPVCFRVGRHRQILHDNAVGTASRRGIHRLVHGGKFVVHHQRVDREIHFYTVVVAVAYGIRQTFPREVIRVAAGVEVRQAEIHRICAAAHGCLQLFRSAHRGQDLRSSAFFFRHDFFLEHRL